MNPPYPRRLLARKVRGVEEEALHLAYSLLLGIIRRLKFDNSVTASAAPVRVVNARLIYPAQALCVLRLAEEKVEDAAALARAAIAQEQWAKKRVDADEHAERVFAFIAELRLEIIRDAADLR